MPTELDQSVERAAQHCFARLVAQPRQATPADTVRAAPVVYAEVDPDSLELTQPRSIGVEHVAVAALRELAFEPLLPELGINGVMRTAIVGSLIARMAAPGSELASHRWLTGTSGLGALLDVDLAALRPVAPVAGLRCVAQAPRADRDKAVRPYRDPLRSGDPRRAL